MVNGSGFEHAAALRQQSDVGGDTEGFTLEPGHSGICNANELGQAWEQNIASGIGRVGSAIGAQAAMNQRISTTTLPVGVIDEATGRTTLHYKRAGGLSDPAVNVLLATYQQADQQLIMAAETIQRAEAITRAAEGVKKSTAEALEKLGYDLSDGA